MSDTEFRKRADSEYDRLVPTWRKLKEQAINIIETELAKIEVSPFAVRGRVKAKESFLTKARDKAYEDPFTQTTDIVGLRIIVYFEYEIEKVSDALKGCFQIDEKNSIDKRIPSKPDTVGYRSLHLIASLGAERSKLGEYIETSKFVFEVQIRTILQHAWAEIEHKENYKSSSALPEDLKRRLFIVAGTLELLDSELASIKQGATEERFKLENRAQELGAEKLDAFHLRVACSQAATAMGREEGFGEVPASTTEKLLDELRLFGVDTVEALSLILEAPEAKALCNSNSMYSLPSFVRDLMLITDHDRFLDKSYEYRNFQFREADVPHLADLLNIDFRAVLQKKGIEIVMEE